MQTGTPWELDWRTCHLTVGRSPRLWKSSRTRMTAHPTGVSDGSLNPEAKQLVLESQAIYFLILDTFLHRWSHNRMGLFNSWLCCTCLGKKNRASLVSGFRLITEWNLVNLKKKRAFPTLGIMQYSFGKSVIWITAWKGYWLKTRVTLLVLRRTLREGVPVCTTWESHASPKWASGSNSLSQPKHLCKLLKSTSQFYGSSLSLSMSDFQAFEGEAVAFIYFMKIFHEIEHLFYFLIRK